MTQWEAAIREALWDAGYATGYYASGISAVTLDGCNDHGSDEWFGIPRTTDESLWPSSPGWQSDIMPAEKMMEGKKGEKSRELKV